MKKLQHKKQGFTLVEILLVVFMVSILAIVAIRSYINSTDTFNFLSQYKNVFSSIRMARSYAITNKDLNGVVPSSYGVKIEAKAVTLFADNGGRPYQFDAVNPAPGAPAADTVIATKTYSLQNTPYVLSATGGSDQPLALPVLLFYDKSSAEFSARYGVDNTILQKASDRYLALKLSGPNNDPLKYIVIFQVSGLAEEYDQIAEL